MFFSFTSFLGRHQVVAERSLTLDRLNWRAVATDESAAQADRPP
jgi:hypothetical protein